MTGGEHRICIIFLRVTRRESSRSELKGPTVNGLILIIGRKTRGDKPALINDSDSSDAVRPSSVVTNQPNQPRIRLNVEDSETNSSSSKDKHRELSSKT